MTTLNRGIQSQFWNLKEPKFPPFDLNIKVVKRLPSKIHKHAEELLCWGFMADSTYPMLHGYPMKTRGLIKQPIGGGYATINEFGIMQKLLVFNINRSFKLNLNLSLSTISIIMDMYRYDSDPYYDSDQLKDLVYHNAVEQGLIE